MSQHRESRYNYKDHDSAGSSAQPLLGQQSSDFDQEATLSHIEQQKGAILEHVVAFRKDVIDMGGEANRQLRTLGRINDQTSTIEAGVQNAQRGLDEIRRSPDDSWLMVVIVMLIIVLVILIAVL